jgi:hypothetical protein
MGTPGRLTVRVPLLTLTWITFSSPDDNPAVSRTETPSSTTQAPASHTATHRSASGVSVDPVGRPLTQRHDRGLQFLPMTSLLLLRRRSETF